jgi:hypothetical protein
VNIKIKMAGKRRERLDKIILFRGISKTNRISTAFSIL